MDDTGKPWLLEVNSSPALSVEGDIDATVKTQLLNDTFDLLNFTPPQAYWYEPRFLRTSRTDPKPAKLERIEPIPMTSIRFPPLQKVKETGRMMKRNTSRQTFRASVDTFTISSRSEMKVTCQEDEEMDFLLSERKKMKSIKSYNNPAGDVAELQAAAEAAEPRPMEEHYRHLIEELTRTRTVPASTEARPHRSGNYELICPTDRVTVI